jgi:hypothetical protein
MRVVLWRHIAENKAYFAFRGGGTANGKNNTPGYCGFYDRNQRQAAIQI